MKINEDTGTQMNIQYNFLIKMIQKAMNVSSRLDHARLNTNLQKY